MTEQQRTIGGAGPYSVESLITYDNANRILTLTHEIGSVGGGGNAPVSGGGTMGPDVLGGIIDQFVYCLQLRRAGDAGRNLHRRHLHLHV